MDDERASRRRFVATVAGLSAVGLSGCGSDGSDTDEPDDDDETTMAGTSEAGGGKGTATAEPTDPPTAEPTEAPTDEPTEEPTDEPTEEPTDEPTETATPAPPDLVDWPTYMYNNQNWGNHPDANGPQDGVTVAWERDLEGAEVNATAVLADGTLFVGDGRHTDDDGRLYALDAQTGDTQWQISLSGPVTGGTAVDENGSYYIAAGSDFIGFREDGSQLWSFESNADLNFASPTVANGYVYFGADSGRLFKLDALSSARDWTYLTAAEIPSAPIVHDGMVYVASRDGSVYALNESNGSEEWVADIGGAINGLSMRDNRLYAASENNTVVKLDTVGDTLWTRSFDDGAATTPAIAGDKVYVGLRNDAFVALDQGDGVEQWRFNDTDGSFTAPAAVVGGTVYVGCHDNNVYALDAETGEQQWSYATGNNIVDPAPVVSGNTVFIGSRDGSFYALTG